MPARVYWFRRMLVLLTALALVFTIGRLLNGSVSASTEDKATVSAATPSTTSAGPAGPLPIQAGATGKSRSPAATGTGAPVVVAQPTGPCADDEITVTPTVPSAVAGRPVDLVLELTGIRPACTFSVSSQTVVAKVTSGQGRIWSSQDCPVAVRPGPVVVRSAQPTTVVGRWSGRRSDGECSRSTPWAMPGNYHVEAAVVGSDPGDAQFRMSSPPRPVVTVTAQPKPKKTKQPKVD